MAGNPAEPARVAAHSVQDQAVLEDYLLTPDSRTKRLGIACSGGGIRSASYSLGALQVLREAGVLARAEYLSAASGGCYTAIAHSTMVATTGGDFPEDPEKNPVRPKDDKQRARALTRAFQDLAPWAPGSPEEKNLRFRPGYLAAGARGKLWLAANLTYGIVRHLLPFAAGIVLAGALTGLMFHQWVDVDGGVATLPAVWISVGLAVAALLSLAARQAVQSKPRPSDTLLQTLQGFTMTLAIAAIATLALIVALPELLVFLRHYGRGPLGPRAVHIRVLLGGVGATLLLLGLSFLAQRGRFVRVSGLLTLSIGPLLVIVPYIGVTYWATVKGLHWSRSAGDPWPLWFATGAAVLLAIFANLDEVTPNMHLFYRERLATIFTGERALDTGGTDSFVYVEPPWSVNLYLSWMRAQDVLRRNEPELARLPKLIVCAAVSLSDAVPPGRHAASFTFERDKCGGPLTRYVPTRALEGRAGPGVLTMPAMMAISGAALAPSMGRRTKPGLRLLMALFNIRLGVWLPNPLQEGGQRASELRLSREESATDAEATVVDPSGAESRLPDTRFRRPGALYVLREALGMNSLRNRYVYVTDGGHWDNLGLVELLRRGCTEIVCFDASGDDARHFHTLSNAISLARSDLNVIITIDTKNLEPGEGELSPKDVVRGDILYPNGVRGTLVYAKSVLPVGAPPDLVSFRQVDPKFPNHSTVDQFFDERKYESYRALGFNAAIHAVVELNNNLAKSDRFDLGDLAPAKGKGERS